LLCPGRVNRAALAELWPCHPDNNLGADVGRALLHHAGQAGAEHCPGSSASQVLQKLRSLPHAVVLLLSDSSRGILPPVGGWR